MCRLITIITLLSYSLTYIITYLLTYLPTPHSRILLEKPTSFQLVKKFPAFYGARRFITISTRAHHLSLSWATYNHIIYIKMQSKNSCLGNHDSEYKNKFQVLWLPNSGRTRINIFLWKQRTYFHLLMSPYVIINF